MDLEPSVVIPIAVAVLGLVGGQVLAVFSRRHDRQQSARTTLLEPAREFATSALTALAALRHVTPPSASKGGEHHRNTSLLSDHVVREERMEACRRAVDSVRVARAGVRLSFHPKSWAAEYSRQTLAALRLCIESAENFYSLHDRNGGGTDWLETASPALRGEYKQHRVEVYTALDNFFEDVAERLRAPTWTPSKIPAARRPEDARWSGS
jgi:hypothetical protein